jgi:hypothetical protein
MGFAQPQNREFFITAKAQGTALPASGLARDLLIQQSLDPGTRSIGLVRLESDARMREAYLVERPDGCHLLDFAPSGSPHGPDFVELAASLGHSVLAIDQAEVTTEPRFTTARTIWSHRFEQIPTAMAMAISSHLADEGPLTLHQICCAIPGPRNPVGVVLAMLCADQVELVDELSELTSHTRFRSRS